MTAPTKNKKLLRWVESVAAICQPDNIHWCDGSKEEADKLFAGMVAAGVATKLCRPDSYLFRTDKADTARREGVTYICSEKASDAGPTNQWRAPSCILPTMQDTFAGCMTGRTLYVIPFSMGPVGSPLAKIGVEISDSPYVVVNMRIMARIGKAVMDILDEDESEPSIMEATEPFYSKNTTASFVRCLHSVGYPLRDIKTNIIRPDIAWPSDLSRTYIAHFTDGTDPSIVSYGSGYGGNALLGKKCLALRIASVIARREGWLAEHMLICGVTDENGNKTYLTGAFPSACGKTNLALLKVPEELARKGWKVTTVGDDIAWIRPFHGKLYAINPENGFFGVAPGTSYKTNASAMESIKSGTIFTNVAYNPETNDVWWEDMDDTKPARLIDWLGQEWTPDCGRLSSHSNSRFTAPIINCPILDERWNDLSGVPISAFLYGGRRATDIPLVSGCFNWAHGVYSGAMISSETTSAALDVKEGTLRNDPNAMSPFIGYHCGDYLAHHLRVGKKLKEVPMIFNTNWFRRDANKKFMWPGFSDNARVLQWIVKRCQGRVTGLETALGIVPKYEDFDWEGLNYTKEQFEALMHIDKEGLISRTLANHQQLLDKLQDKAPGALLAEKTAFAYRLFDSE